MFDTAAKGYSADVQIDLIMDGQSFSVSQVVVGKLIFDAPPHLPGTTGELVVTIDGHARRWRAELLQRSNGSSVVMAELQEINTP